MAVNMDINRHFKEKEDTLLYKVQQYYEVARLQLHKNSPTLIELLEFRYKLIKESPNLELIYKMNKLQLLFDTFRSIYSSDIKTALPLTIDPYTSVFTLSGMDAITNLWIQNGRTEHPKKMARLTAQIIENMYHSRYVSN
jgi:hypothetical protein